ncbi:unnamed protein product [Parnassius apollo]|uniref:(apollo) hypothetical protein n=1 Tax=Parnassius apollo TaxID=110799 RepID=A0A8S3X7Y5_PARAO|nr:unnamed protein product [Parnassius apollo]
MSSDEYQVQNIYRYCRKSYKNNRSGSLENYTASPRDDADSEAADSSPRNDIKSDEIKLAAAGCNCDLDPDNEIANILHKKCPVIALAQLQLQKILDETDRLLSETTRDYRSPYDVLCFCKEAILNLNKYEYALIILVFLAFLFGVLLGAASCKSQHGKFNSFIFTCLDNLLTPDTYPIDKSFRCIA